MDKKMQRVPISVLITNFNHARYLPECLDAVFSQSALPQEVIVIDDASTDGSIPLLRDYQAKYPELIVLQNTKNQGPAKAMNRCIRHAQAKYIVLAAADDHVLPGFFEEASHYLDLYPEAGICCSEPTMFESGPPPRFWRIPISYDKKAIFIPPEAMERRYLHTPLWIPTHASLYRRDLLLKYGCLEDSLKHLCDWYLNCKIAMMHGIIYVPRSFGAFRVSLHSYSERWRRSYRKKLEIYQTLFLLLRQEPEALRKKFYRSGALGLIASDVFVYLMCHPSLWGYFPRAFYRKVSNFFRKLCRWYQAKNQRGINQ